MHHPAVPTVLFQNEARCDFFTCARFSILYAFAIGAAQPSLLINLPLGRAMDSCPEER